MVITPNLRAFLDMVAHSEIGARAESHREVPRPAGIAAVS